MHTYIHTCTYIHIHTYIYIQTYTYIHYIHRYIHTYIHTYTHTYLHTYIHTYIQTCIHTYIHACIHAYMHTYIHTYIHTRFFVLTFVRLKSSLTANWGRRHWAAALKSGHRGASDPVVRDTAEGLGPEGLPSGIGPAALCRRPLPTMSRPCAIILRWARPYKGRRISGFVQAIFGGFLSISPRSQKTSVFWGVPIVDSIPGITCIIRILGGH